ncbi:MAG: pyridoxamine 5'-phosphate oxidase family protein [Candidatus Omnitrophota bacterium]
MIKDKVRKFLEHREFVSVATSDLCSRPNAAPKFVLKTDRDCIYLVDYSISRTWQNLRINPRASLSFMDTDNLVGYHINGFVEIIDKGPSYEEMSEEFNKKELALSSKRIVEAVTTGKRHRAFEVGSLKKKFRIYKIKIQEVVEIGPEGNLEREVIKE